MLQSIVERALRYKNGTMESKDAQNSILTSEHLNHYAANGPHVNHVVPAESHHHFRGTVLTGTDESISVAIKSTPLCGAEVDKPNFGACWGTWLASLPTHQADIFRLYIRVDELERVYVFQCLNGLADDVSHSREGIRAKLVSFLKFVPKTNQRRAGVVSGVMVVLGRSRLTCNAVVRGRGSPLLLLTARVRESRKQCTTGSYARKIRTSPRLTEDGWAVCLRPRGYRFLF